MLLDLARNWDDLAEQRVAQLSQRERARGIGAALLPSIV
jgi:hypothetical protein